MMSGPLYLAQHQDHVRLRNISIELSSPRQTSAALKCLHVGAPGLKTKEY
jgi:hypothetical protein